MKKIAKVDKGASTPGREVKAQITLAQIKEIAEQKYKDLNANDIDNAAKIIAGSARSMGFQVLD